MPTKKPNATFRLKSSIVSSMHSPYEFCTFVILRTDNLGPSGLMQVSVAESQRDEAIAQLKEYKAEVRPIACLPSFHGCTDAKPRSQMEIRQAAIADRHEAAMRSVAHPDAHRRTLPVTVSLMHQALGGRESQA
jgi:hypothetical protein